jgi:CheY-like chemotaxis protein
MDILLVGDHNEDQTTLSSLLTNCGDRVFAAENLEEALCLLGFLRFDMLVSDISLSDGSGLDLVAEAKKRQTWRKTVALTGRMEPGEFERIEDAGFDEYLPKPVDFYRLRSLLAQTPSGRTDDSPGTMRADVSV